MVVGLGKSPEAELLLERLLRVAPLDLYFRAERMRHFLYTREYERGIAEAERIRELDPEFADIDIGWLYFLPRPARGRSPRDARLACAWRSSLDPTRGARRFSAAARRGGGREGCGP